LDKLLLGICDEFGEFTRAEEGENNIDGVAFVSDDGSGLKLGTSDGIVDFCV